MPHCDFVQRLFEELTRSRSQMAGKSTLLRMTCAAIIMAQRELAVRCFLATKMC